MRVSVLAALAATMIAATVFVPADPARRLPDDPLFVHQVSFRDTTGAVTLRRSSTRLDSLVVEARPGIGLDLPGAWAHTTGSRAVVVALLDDGFFYRHPDVAPNVWANPGEVGMDSSGLPRETNRIDDDGNGYVDDVAGWDFAFDDPDPDPYVFDGMDRGRIQPYRHSIPAMGIVGAAGDDGRGTAGINWEVSLMLLKIGHQGIRRGERDTLRARRAAEAIRYAADNGARVVNWSGFVSHATDEDAALVRDAIAYAGEREVLVVVGAGNDGVDLDDPGDRVVPQSFQLPNLLKVAEVGFDGTLYRYELGDRVLGSNYGRRRVQLGAIGMNFTTDLVHGREAYGLSGGTSNAGPVVAGVAALVLSVRPELGAEALRDLLLSTVTPVPELAGRVASGGVVNARRAVEAAVAGP